MTTTQLTTNVHDTALIFEGGGMRGAYTAPVVSTLLEAGIHVEWFAGISAGSTHVCNYASRDAARARRSFVDIVSDPEFGGMRSFLRGDGYFNAAHIYEHTSLPDEWLPFDWATYRDNPVQPRVGAFNATRGEEVWFTKEDMSTLVDLTVRVRASSTLPVLMPPVTIDGEVFVDGALGPDGGIALDAAESEGYEKFFVVLTRSRTYVKGPQRFPSAAWLRRRYRDLPCVAEGILARPDRYNETRRRVFELEQQGRALVFAPEDLHITNTEKRLSRLERTWEAGLAQARRELPRWQEFLGV